MDKQDLVFLLVDDNFMMLKMMMPMLEQLGYRHFLLAREGKEALWQLKQNDNINIVLSDLIMPKMDGIELLLKIRDSEKFWDMPFVMITGEENQNQLMSSIEIDVNSYILKPFTPEKLEKEIDAVLKEKYNPSPFQRAMQDGRRLLVQEARHEQAMEYFEQAKMLKPLEADPHYFMGIIYERQGDYQRAKIELQKCIYLKEAHTKAYDLLALILHREKDYAAEKKVLSTLTELSPDNLERNINLAVACANTGDKKAMKDFLQKATRLAKKKKSSFERIFRSYLLQDGHVEEAEAIYRKYIDRHFDQPRLLNKYALILKEAKAFDSAISFLERIENMWRDVRNHGIPSEDMAVYLFNLAVAHIERAKTYSGEDQQPAYEKAAMLVNKSIDCAPGNPDAGKLLDWLEQR